MKIPLGTLISLLNWNVITAEYAYLKPWSEVRYNYGASRR